MQERKVTSTNHIFLLLFKFKLTRQHSNAVYSITSQPHSPFYRHQRVVICVNGMCKYRQPSF